MAIGAVIVVGFLNFDPANLGDFVVDPKPSSAPPDTIIDFVLGTSTTFGWVGVFAAAPAIAFAYIGFDIVATAAEEAADAPRTIPQGMIRSLVVATLIYIGVALVMVGMVPHTAISVDAPLPSGFRQAGAGWMVHVVNVGAVLGLTTVILVLIVGQTRVLFSMARDGLLPRRLAGLSRYRSPARITALIGLIAIGLALFAPLPALEELVVMGTLCAFLAVSAGVLVIRRSRPDLSGDFRAPLHPWVPILSLLAILWLMVNLKVATWVSFAVWMAFGLVVYLLYGRRHSLLATPRAATGRGRHRR
ncbi:APC family permease [Nonomuraea sp. NPDC050328]|uniref:APC family permease n=1 Tax=Nonomuraea sp. NPDC050328 TaxID=3364361 RepID=UPI0037AFCBFB